MRMKHAQPIIRQLVDARKRQGISQAELGKKMGLPQSHLSKIESGETDPRMSSLIEIARLLGFELVLIPKQLVPAIQAVVKGEALDIQPSLPASLLEENENE